MKKIILLIFFLKFNFAFSQKVDSFYGTWCNSDSWNKTGEIFQIEIAKEKNNINVVYYNGAPFEEFYTAKYTKKGTLILFFTEISGSISFNKVSNVNNVNSNSNCKKKTYATCKIIASDTLQITTFKNDCSYMPSDTIFILKKLKENDSCIPN